MATTSSRGGAPPRVFISYSHDSQEHRDRVLVLANRLCEDGVDVQLDQYEVSPPQGWPHWMLDQIEEADFVLVVCTEVYHQRFRGKGTGRGVKFEGAVLTQTVYDAESRNERFIPVLFSSEDADHRPVVLRGASFYVLDEGYEDLYRHLTGQPETPKPELGPARVLPPREVPEQIVGREDEEEDAEPPSELDHAFERRAEILASGGDTTQVDTEILGIKREIREGGRLHPGDRLGDGRYQLREPVGTGGFATVWRAYDTKRKKPVAIKVLHGQFSHDRTRRERFFRGARQMAALRHPAIVRVLEEELEDGGFHFFVMEYVAGGDLRRVIRDGKLLPDQACALVLQVGEALSEAHQRGVIHRDVKPANILITMDGQPKLTDFDLVRAMDTTGGTRTGALGTFIYAAPEQLTQARQVDQRADVYGLAMTLLCALRGQDLPPDILWDHEPTLAALECTGAVREVLRRGIARMPDDRWSSVVEFRRAFEAARAALDSVGRGKAVEIVTRDADPGSNIVRIAPGQPAAGTLWEGPLGMRFRYVPAGVYVVGSPEDEPGRQDREWLPHEVKLTRGVWMAETPVTQAQWSRLVPDNPSRFSDNRWEHPVEQVNWYEAVAFANRLSEEAGLEPCYSLNGQRGELGKDFKCASVELLQPLRSGFRLPTEAEWEIAARAGTAGARYAENLDEIAWYGKNSGKRTHSVASKSPNAWGLHDMLGNVWEWAGDRFSREQPTLPRVDPLGPENGPNRVFRGGSWVALALGVRAAYRGGSEPGYRYGDLGFRLSRGPQPGGAALR